MVRTPKDALHDFHNLPIIRDTESVYTSKVIAHLGELRTACMNFIGGSEIVVGSVAWLTDPDIIKVLSRRFVALTVQKENWWKKTDARGQRLAKGYASLQGGLPASAFPEPLAHHGDVMLAPIACVGYSGGTPFSPLHHHKFLVRCRVAGGTGKLVADALWTGSFNLTKNASEGFENAVEIHDPIIANAYLHEFALMAAMSEPMNWRRAQPDPHGLGTVFKVKSGATRAPRARVSR